MRFSLKISEWTYGLEIGRTARSVTVDVRPEPGRMASVLQENPIFNSRPIAPVSLL
jgi:hypothetical protein